MQNYLKLTLVFDEILFFYQAGVSTFETLII